VRERPPWRGGPRRRAIKDKHSAAASPAPAGLNQILSKIFNRKPESVRAALGADGHVHFRFATICAHEGGDSRCSVGRCLTGLPLQFS
jgi:hypothetical protein